MSAIDQVPDEKARAVLRRLHGEAGREYGKLMWKYLPYFIPMLSGKTLPWDRLERRHDEDYMAITPGGGMHLYLLARALGARRIVEFGTSFGVSTIWLALAVRDNGGGTVIGTEYIPAKAARARANFMEAGLAEYIDLRVGNAVETLRDLEAPVDFLSSDGFPRYALPVLQMVAPKMRRGAIVLNHNASAMKGDHAGYLAYVRDPANGFVSSDITLVGELSVRTAG